ncbi:MAG: dNTP triphosphohydrolase [Pirellulaceae bacterium]
MLASFASFSRDTRGRRYPERRHPYRGPFQRDRDRILHSSAFRRLSGKMQVFTGDMGEYHRTRLTHTFEVASVARTIARVLRLNEDLTEALGLMHDIGHPPYGHCGEDVLNECLAEVGGFSHNQFALTIAEELEQRATGPAGLNLSAEVLAGQDNRAHKAEQASGVAPALEVQVVDLADSIAYDAADVDDALQMGLLTLDDLSRLRIVARALRQVCVKQGSLPPSQLRPALVHELVEMQVTDLLEAATGRLVPWSGRSSVELQQAEVRLKHSPELSVEREELETFLFNRVYRHARLVQVRSSAGDRLASLFDRLLQSPDRLPLRFRLRIERVGTRRAIGEYLAGMTDRFCDSQYQSLQDGTGPLADW